MRPGSRSNEAEFDALFVAEYASILQAAVLIVGDPEVAREVAQEAFTKLFVHWAKVSCYERPGAWVRRVAIHDAMRVAGRDRRRRRAATRYLENRLANRGPDPRPADDARLDQLAAAMDELSPQQRAAVVLFYLEDLPVAEVAEALGTSPSTARVHLHRARLRLGDRLDEEISDVAG